MVIPPCKNKKPRCNRQRGLHFFKDRSVPGLHDEMTGERFPHRYGTLFFILAFLSLLCADRLALVYDNCLISIYPNCTHCQANR